MSYDLHCYKSKLGHPDLDEAKEGVELDEEEKFEKITPKQKIIMEKVATALRAYNPKLEFGEKDFVAIAEMENSTVEEAKEKYSDIELNTPDGELATQISIFGSVITVIVPYWYSDDRADLVFQKVHEYTKIIHQTTGYFVYDPQTETAYNPLEEEFNGLDTYNKTVKYSERLGQEEKKPWWKFW
jgi:hypothetical protein